MSVIGLIGILIFFAGMHLLWQGRREIFFWLEEFLRILRGEFSRRKASMATPEVSHQADPAASGGEPSLVSAARSPRQLPVKPRQHGTLRLVGGLALVFLGQVLLILDLAF